MNYDSFDSFSMKTFKLSAVLEYTEALCVDPLIFPPYLLYNVFLEVKDWIKIYILDHIFRKLKCIFFPQYGYLPINCIYHLKFNNMLNRSELYCT